MAEIESSQGSGGNKMKTKKASTKVDMTPMVDLAFLLITFFMLTTTFNKSKAITMIKPPLIDTVLKEASQDELKDENSLTIYVWENDKIYWSNKFDTKAATPTNYTAEGIRAVIADRKKVAGDKLTVMVKMHPKAKYNNLIDVLDEYYIANIKNIYFISDATATEYERVKNAGM